MLQRRGVAAVPAIKHFSNLVKNYSNRTVVCLHLQCKVPKRISLSEISPSLIKSIHLSSHTQHATSDVNPINGGKILLYKWPTMRQFRFISRLKLYQVTTMLFLLPPVAYWYHLGEISTKGLINASVAALGTAGVLAIISHYFRRVIGEMVYCPQNSNIKLSTLTFMGGRRDLWFSVDRVVPFLDCQKRMGGSIQWLEVKGHPEVFLYSLRYGHVMNSDLMFHMLGIPG